jgi:hypothetical protein
VFAMINKSGVRLMPVDGAADAMDIFFGIGEVQLYQVRCFCLLLFRFA